MARHVLLSFLAIVLLSACGPTQDLQALGVAALDRENVTVCPAVSTEEAPPDFSAPECQVMDIGDANPQNQLVWIRAFVPLEETRGPAGEPLVLFVSGKMSSIAYLNGLRVGQNGTPGANSAREETGLMDAVFYPAQDLFQIGDNEVVLLASSHQGYLELERPVHLIGIAPADLLSRSTLAWSAPILITLGIFLLGGLYFSVMAVIGAARFQFALLAAMSFSAGGQLISESLRGLTAYAYPVHDLRLIAITAFSAVFALCAALHILRRFEVARLLWVMGVVTLVSGATILGAEGYDFKALAAMTTPLLICLIATGVWTAKLRAGAFPYFVCMLAFVAAIFAFDTLFLDLVFFLMVAVLVLLLFVDQARSLAAEARERSSEEARANRLEQALAQVEEKAETGFIDVKGAGQIKRIATSDIVHCKGAGGYCELSLADGQTLLHTASLNEMEDALPATFLRIHRSHLVNIQFIQSLVRDPSGTGTLYLKGGAALPVSRRIMPKVRKALS